MGGGDILRFVDQLTREGGPRDAAPSEGRRDPVVARAAVRRVVAAGDNAPRADGCRERRHDLRRIAAHDGQRCPADLERGCQRGYAPAHEPQAIGRAEASGLETLVEHEQGGDPGAVGLRSGQRRVVLQAQVSAEPDNTRRHGRPPESEPHLGSSVDIATSGADGRAYDVARFPARRVPQATRPSHLTDGCHYCRGECRNEMSNVRPVYEEGVATVKDRDLGLSTGRTLYIASSPRLKGG